LVSFSALISEFTQLLNRTRAGIDCRSNYPQLNNDEGQSQSTDADQVHQCVQTSRFTQWGCTRSTGYY